MQSKLLPHSFIIIYFFNRTNYNRQSKLKDLDFAVKKSFNAALMKILLNYTQSSTIMNSLRINWGTLIGGVFQASKILSGNLQQVIALECLIKSNNLKYSLSFFFVIC